MGGGIAFFSVFLAGGVRSRRFYSEPLYAEHLEVRFCPSTFIVRACSVPKRSNFSLSFLQRWRCLSAHPACSMPPLASFDGKLSQRFIQIYQFE